MILDITRRAQMQKHSISACGVDLASCIKGKHMLWGGLFTTALCTADSVPHVCGCVLLRLQRGHLLFSQFVQIGGTRDAGRHCTQETRSCIWGCSLCTLTNRSLS